MRLFSLQVLQYLLDDISDFLSTHFVAGEGEREVIAEEKGCVNLLKAFIDYISERESENFRSRRHDNQSSVTLTTIHQVLDLFDILLMQTFLILILAMISLFVFLRSSTKHSWLTFFLFHSLAVKRFRVGYSFHN